MIDSGAIPAAAAYPAAGGRKPKLEPEAFCNSICEIIACPVNRTDSSRTSAGPIQTGRTRSRKRIRAERALTGRSPNGTYFGPRWSL